MCKLKKSKSQIFTGINEHRYTQVNFQNSSVMKIDQILDRYIFRKTKKFKYLICRFYEYTIDFLIKYAVNYTLKRIHE